MYSKDYRARMKNYDRMRSEQIKVSQLITHTRNLKSRVKRRKLLEGDLDRSRSRSPLRISNEKITKQHLNASYVLNEETSMRDSQFLNPNEFR